MLHTICIFFVDHSLCNSNSNIQNSRSENGKECILAQQPIMKSFMLLITYRLTFLCASADRYGFFFSLLFFFSDFHFHSFILSPLVAIRKLIILVLVQFLLQLCVWLNQFQRLLFCLAVLLMQWLLFHLQPATHLHHIRIRYVAF